LTSGSPSPRSILSEPNSRGTREASTARFWVQELRTRPFTSAEGARERP
jgi:hypothetical protein